LASRATSLIVGRRFGSSGADVVGFVAGPGFIVFFMSPACARGRKAVKQDKAHSLAAALRDFALRR